MTKQSVGEKVRFLFKHALAKFGGSTQKGDGSDKTDPAQSGLKIVLDVDANSTNPGIGISNQTNYFTDEFDATKTLVTINEIKIRDANTYSRETGVIGTVFDEEQQSDLNRYGWFNIATGKWENGSHPTGVPHTIDGDGTWANLTINTTGSGDGVGKLNPKIMEVGVQQYDAATEKQAEGQAKMLSNTRDAWTNAPVNPVGVNIGTPIPVYENANYDGIVLIPGDDPQTFYITVDYYVRTADSQLKNGYSQVRQIITNKVQVSDLEANKYYTLIIHLGLTSVKFEAVVVDWAMNSGDTYDEDGETNTNPATEENQTVWLPSNVVNTTTITADANTSHKSVTVAADLTSYTVEIGGLTAGSTLTKAVSGAGIADANAVTLKQSDGTTNLGGAGNNEVPANGIVKAIVTLTPNNTGSEISNTVTITSTDGSETKITITQAAGVLTLSRSLTEVPETSTAVIVTATNGTAAVALTLATDVTITPAPAASPAAAVSGSGNNEISFTIPANTTPYARDITVAVDNHATPTSLTGSTTINQAAGTQKVNITVSTGSETNKGTVGTGENVDVITFEKDAIETTPTYTVKINGENYTDGSYTFSKTASWITVDPSTGKITASENKASSDRKATITLTHSSGAKVTCTVIQKGATI